MRAGCVAPSENRFSRSRGRDAKSRRLCSQRSGQQTRRCERRGGGDVERAECVPDVCGEFAAIIGRTRSECRVPRVNERSVCAVWSCRRGHAGGTTTRRARSEWRVPCVNERSVCRVVMSPRTRRRHDHTAHTERVCCFRAECVSDVCGELAAIIGRTRSVLRGSFCLVG